MSPSLESAWRAAGANGQLYALRYARWHAAQDASERSKFHNELADIYRLLNEGHRRAVAMLIGLDLEQLEAMHAEDKKRETNRLREIQMRQQQREQFQDAKGRR